LMSEDYKNCNCDTNIDEFYCIRKKKTGLMSKSSKNLKQYWKSTI
jgi:hypothetical protein